MVADTVKLRMTLSSIPKNIGRVEKFVNKVSARFLLDEIKLNKVMVSLTEAVNNAIVHGNKSNPAKKVTVICDGLPGWLLFIVNDEGKTSIDRVYAGGDIVLGAATVILAMGEGRRAAAAINKLLA